MEDYIKRRTLVFIHTDITVFTAFYRQFKLSREKCFGKHKIAVKSPEFVCSKGEFAYLLPVGIPQHHILADS